MSKKKDLTGQKFGRLTAIEEAGKDKEGKTLWKCVCDCKEIVKVITKRLTSGHTKSCGCYRLDRLRETITTHGQKTKKGITPTYISWRSMMDRCYNPNSSVYHNYGGRGIKVCKRWWKFENFYEDMEERPKGKTLDRKNNNRGYYPKNCRWATQKEQTRNARTKGCSWDNTKQKWIAVIGVNYKQIFLGSFDTPEEAQEVYRQAKIKYHGIDPFKE